jgi:hypothetical protein
MSIKEPDEPGKALIEVQTLEAQIKAYNKIIQLIKTTDLSTISDGYQTFEELYFHRMILFSIICNQNKNDSWKSKLYYDGTMYDNYFIVGINTKKGQYTYHYHMEYWDYFAYIPEILTAPEWDGHEPKDITRLLSLL